MAITISLASAQPGAKSATGPSPAVAATSATAPELRASTLFGEIDLTALQARVEEPRKERVR